MVRNSPREGNLILTLLPLDKPPSNQPAPPQKQQGDKQLGSAFDANGAGQHNDLPIQPEKESGGLTSSPCSRSQTDDCGSQPVAQSKNGLSASMYAQVGSPCNTTLAAQKSTMTNGLPSSKHTHHIGVDNNVAPTQTSLNSHGLASSKYAQRTDAENIVPPTKALVGAEGLGPLQHSHQEENDPFFDKSLLSKKGLASSMFSQSMRQDCSVDAANRPAAIKGLRSSMFA